MSSSPPLVVADRYRLVAPLGQGGMGRVWRANDVVLHRDVAIKELVPPPGLTPDERQEMRERSLREARAIARLNNVNVVRVFDVLRTDADPWIVMEYVPSRSLHDTLASDGPFPPVRAAEIGLGVLGALRAAHRAGVVHRDVKPGNVLLGGDGRVVLTDFGLATVPGDPNVTRTGLVLGSPAYIAPERARDGTAGPAADLWSLGATLYAAVEGTSPFARPSAIATLAALATENPPPARNAGPLKPVLNGLLRKDPAHRINAEEAERLLLRATGRRSKLTFPMSPTMRRPGVGRERPALPTGPTGTSTPVVPGPRPPVAQTPAAPSRPGNPPGQAPVPGGRVAAGDGRPPVFVPGKAQVGRPSADTPTRVDGPKVIDSTRVDTPAVRDGGGPFSRTRPAPDASPAGGSGSPTVSPSHTSRGSAGFTAADVAANRRKKAAPEQERSLTDAATPQGLPADATTVVPPSARPGARRTPAAQAPEASADATTVMPAPGRPSRRGAPDAGTVVPATSPPAGADATTIVPPPAKTPPAKTLAASADATTVMPAQAGRGGKRPLSADATTVVPPTKGKGAKRKGAAAAPAQPTPGTTADADKAATESATAAAAVAAAAATAMASTADAQTTEKPDAATTDAETSDGVTTDAATSDAATAAKTDAATAGKTDGATAGKTDGATAAETDAGLAEKPDAATAAEAGGATATQAETSPADVAEHDVSEADAEQADASTADKVETAKETADAEDEPAAAATAIENHAAEGDAAESTAIGDETSTDESAAAAGDPSGEGSTPDAAAGATAIEPKTLSGEVSAPTSPASAPVSGAPGGSADDDLPPYAPRSTRPAWRPMPSGPAARKPGVTLFGTRLTYTQAGIGGAIILIVLLLLITLAAKAFGGGDKPASNHPTAKAATTAPATAAPSAIATTPSKAPSTAPSSAPATSASASPSASSSASASATGGNVALPAGWKWYTQSGSGSYPGFTIPVPKNAKVSNYGSETHFEWNNRLLIMASTNQPKSDPLQDWKDQEAARKGSYSDYHLIKMVAVSYFKAGADWEFTYTTSRGNAQHADKRNVVVSSKAAYSLSWYTTPDDWSTAQTDIHLIYQGFQPQQ